MGINWESVDWQLSFCQGATIKIILQSLFIVQNGKLTSILRFDVNTWKPLQNATTIAIEEECFDIFEVDEIIYYLSKEGSVFQLLCTPSGSSNDAFGFGSTCSSSESEVFSWLKLSWNVKNPVAVAGLKHAFAAIVKIESSFYYNVYSIKKQLNLTSSTKLPSVPTPLQWTLSCMDSSKLSPEMRLHFFKKLSFVVQDVIFLSTPTGQLFMAPRSFDSSFKFDLTLYCETKHQLKRVYPASAKNLIILVYGSGKIVCLTLEKKKIKCKIFYLPNPVQDATIIEKNDKVFIVWCNGFKMNVGCLANNDLKILKYDKVLYGIETMFSVGGKILACSSNLVVYKVLLNSSETNFQPLVLNSQSILNEMSVLGQQMDDINKEIEKRDVYFNAIEAEQSASGKITVTLNKDTIHLENDSEFLFVKDIWSVLFEGFVENTQKCCSHLLDKDLKPGDFDMLSLPENLKFCESLNVILVGNISPMGRLLKVFVGNIVLQKTKGLDFVAGLEKKLKQMKLNGCR